MTNKKMFRGMLVIVAVFGMVLFGCPTTATEEGTWSNVTSLDQLDGTWKGSYSQTQTIKEFGEANGEWDDSLTDVYGDMKVTTSVDMTMTVNATAKTQATDMTMKMTFSGGNIDTVWSEFSAGFSGPGVEVDDATHSITMTQSFPAASIGEDDLREMLNSGLQINQDGTKVKMPAGTQGEGSPEIIMVKQ